MTVISVRDWKEEVSGRKDKVPCLYAPVWHQCYDTCTSTIFVWTRRRQGSREKRPIMRLQRDMVRSNVQ